MKLNNYTKFLKEAIRDDEYSYLNDDLPFNKMDDRWDDSTYMSEYDYKDEEDSEDMHDLINLFKQMFSNSNIDNVEIQGTSKEIIMYFNIHYRERLKDIVKIFDVLSKIKKDILPQFDSDIDLWRDRKGSPLLTITFDYNEGLDDDNAPF